MTISKRLIDFIHSEGLSVCEFERMISAGNGYVSRIKKSIKPSRLEIISLKFPQLNIQWLLSGEGEMLQKTEKVNEQPGVYLASSKKTRENDKWKHIITALENDIDHQQQTIDYYRNLMKKLSKSE